MDISQFYTFRSSEGKSVQMRRGEGAAVITGGGSRWAIIERPRRSSIVTWTGHDLYTMDVPLLFDGWSSSDSVENDISILNKMRISSDLKAPPTVGIDGALPVKGATWVITDISWGDNVIWHTVGNDAFRLRQDCTVHLLQFNASDKFSVKASATSGIPHTIKSGETLASIAKKHGVDKKDIQKANGLRDPKNIKPGQKLVIPKPSAPTANYDPGHDSGLQSTNIVRRAWQTGG